MEVASPVNGALPRGLPIFFHRYGIRTLFFVRAFRMNQSLSPRRTIHGVMIIVIFVRYALRSVLQATYYKVRNGAYGRATRLDVKVGLTSSLTNRYVYCSLVIYGLMFELLRVVTFRVNRRTDPRVVSGRSDVSFVRQRPMFRLTFVPNRGNASMPLPMVRRFKVFPPVLILGRVGQNVMVIRDGR